MHHWILVQLRLNLLALTYSFWQFSALLLTKPYIFGKTAVWEFGLPPLTILKFVPDLGQICPRSIADSPMIGCTASGITTSVLLFAANSLRIFLC